MPTAPDASDDGPDSSDGDSASGDYCPSATRTAPEPVERNVLASDCTRCPALVESRTCISWGNGPLDASLVVVGEAPGAGDPEASTWQGGNWTGMAYTSRHSGRRIRALLSAVGYGPDDCYYTNAVKCFPSDGAGSNREPTDEEHRNCRPFLRRELETVDPRVVIPTGKHATQSVFALAGADVDSFLDTVLEPHRFDTIDPVVLPLLHPSYQDIWVGRLGYMNDSYRDELDARLNECFTD